MPPTVVVTDRRDGTGADAVFAGTVGGSLNFVFYSTTLAPSASGDVSVVLTDRVTRLGDGSVAINTGPGRYSAYPVFNTGAVLGDPFTFFVTPSPGGPEGSISVPLEKLREMIASCTSFSEAVGTGSDVAATLARIHRTWADASVQPWPCAVVSLAKDASWSSVAGGAGHFLLPESRLIVDLLIEATPQPESDVLAIHNLAGNLVDELIAIAGIDQNLPITHIALAEGGVQRSRPEEDGGRVRPHWTVGLVISCGDVGSS